MSIEKKIEELQKQLAIKTAYLSVEIKFKKGVTIPQDVKDLVTDELLKACAQLAEGVESFTPTNNSSNLASDEIHLLKQVAELFKSKLKNKTLIQQTEPVNNISGTVSGAIRKLGKKRAEIITLDSVQPANLRKKVPSQSIVEIVGYEENRAIADFKGTRFFIDKEDLNFNLEEGE